MTFPLRVLSTIQGYAQPITRTLVLHSGLTVLLGPNGSGKTQLLRGLRQGISEHAAGRKVRFISAGRIGPTETFRSDFDGHRGGNPMYDDASFGSKGDVDRRHLTETLNGDFQTLSQRADILVKIQERLKKLFRRDILIEWDAGSLKVKFARLSGGARPYSAGREASGLLHLVGILTALYDDEVGVLLLDEPEVSLHPQLQAFLIKEIRNAAGHPSEGATKKVIVIATHSTEMLQISKPQDLSSLVFCHEIDVAPVQIDPLAGELSNKKIQALIARLGQEHKLSLFSKRPLLVEGPSDVIVCTAVASRIDMHLEAAGSQLLPVVGKGQLPVVAKLFRLLGKEPVVLADADAVADGLELINEFIDSDADASANAAGFSSARLMAQTIHSDFCAMVSKRWASIKSDSEAHPYWINRKSGEETLAMRRAAFCTLFVLSPARLAILDPGGEWVGMRARLTALLDLLESVGCFVLRRGSVESYYQASDPLTSVGKPSAAAEEMVHISQLPTNQVSDAYSDVARCIVFAAASDLINEAESLRDILLSVVAPAFAKMQGGSTQEEIVIAAQSLAGERSKLFQFQVANGELSVSMASKILHIPSFPLVLRDGDEIISKVNKSLGLVGAGAAQAKPVTH